VILDFGFWGRDERSAPRWLAASAGASCQVVYLPVDRATQRARIARRIAHAPPENFAISQAEAASWRAQFEAPDTAELAGMHLPGPPPGWPGWLDWVADRRPSLAEG
jgi:predicted kinase